MAVWKLAKPPPKSVVNSLNDFPEAVRFALYNRGIKTMQEAQAFFEPSEKQLHDPHLLHDMKKTVSLIESAINKEERIGIHGDFDVDGVSSTAILTDYLLRKRRAKVTPYIPHRVDEGYGLSKESIDALLNKNVKLLITVDCGIKDIELIEYAKKHGLKVILSDHHEFDVSDGKPVLPDADAIVHPRHPQAKYPFGALAGASVAWKIVSALDGKTHAKDYLELAALATVCDVMPLVDENRAIVKLGLKQMNKTQREGLRALISQAGLAEKALDTHHLGFVLGPRINAAGRLGSAIDALKLLLAQESYLATAMAEKLEKLNKERQTLTQQAFEEAEKQVKQVVEQPLLVVSSPDWQEGIIGLIAGKLTEKYHRPALALSISGKKTKGSARSIKGFNIVDALNVFSEHLESYGGHELAAGFSLDTANVKKLKKDLVKLGKKQLDGKALTKKIQVDSKISADQINLELTDYLNKFKPTGFGNPTPTYQIGTLTLLRFEPVGRDQDHLKFFLKDTKSNKTLDAIWFSASKKAFSLEHGSAVNVLANIDTNEWNGKTSIQLRIKDMKVVRN